MSEGAPLLFAQLDVIDDLTPHGAALNMALDELLLLNLQAVPLLRVYRWQRPAVSFGYFTPWKPVFTLYPDRDLVRRWTGGGVVEHGDDVTFSLFVPRSHPLSNGPAGQSYRLIHGALQVALRQIGWADVLLAENVDAPTDGAGAPCFSAPVQHDLLAGGQKISGGAQRRTRVGLLHQGSIRSSTGQAVDPATLAAALPDTLATKWTARSISPDESAAAEQLAGAKYATEVWLGRV